MNKSDLIDILVDKSNLPRKKAESVVNLIFDQMTEEHINYMLSKIPRNKFAKVEELASLVTWLASEENSFSTAAVFDLSGGRATY